MIQYALLLVVLAICIAFILTPYYLIVSPGIINLFGISIGLGSLCAGIAILFSSRRSD